MSMRHLRLKIRRSFERTKTGHLPPFDSEASFLPFGPSRFEIAFLCSRDDSRSFRILMYVPGMKLLVLGSPT